MNVRILYDHYKETCNLMVRYNQKRDRLTLYLIICLTLMLVNSSSPDLITQCVNKYIDSDDSILIINFAVLNSVLTLSTAMISLQYYQICLTVERTYKYIAHLEKDISLYCINIRREGVNYGKNYPILSNIANIFYAWVIPILTAVLAAFRIYVELHEDFSAKGFDGACLSFIILISVVYLSDRNLYWDRLLKKDCRQSVCKRLEGFLNIGETNKETKNHR